MKKKCLFNSGHLRKVDKMTLKEEIENVVGEWLCQQGLLIPDNECDILTERLLQMNTSSTNKRNKRWRAH